MVGQNERFPEIVFSVHQNNENYHNWTDYKKDRTVVSLKSYLGCGTIPQLLDSLFENESLTSSHHDNKLPNSINFLYCLVEQNKRCVYIAISVHQNAEK